MVTKEQAIAASITHTISGEFHYNGCSKIVGPRGGVKYTIETWRVNGRCKTWKTRPNEFRLPIKTGFRGPYSYITHLNCEEFHHVDDCPLNEKENSNV